jgi:hypothetical protein
MDDFKCSWLAFIQRSSKRAGSSALPSALLSISQGAGVGRLPLSPGTDGNEGDQYGLLYDGTAATAFQLRQAYRTWLHFVIVKAASSLAETLS